MKALILIAGIALSLLPPQLGAADWPKKPGPEHKKLAVMTGKWKWEEVYQKTPFGPAGKGTHTSVVRFIHGGLFVEEQGKGRIPEGPYSWTVVTYYDPDRGAYRSFSCGSDGSAPDSVVDFDGTTYVSTSDQKADGKSYKCKNVTVYASDGQSCTYEWTYSEDGGVTWKLWLKGAGKKVGKVK